MRLVVGLGNPGSEYAGTRHNVGWEVLDQLAVRLGWISRKDEFERVSKARFDGLILDGSVPLAGGDQRLLLLKPTTFMNDSGRSVQAVMAFYRLAPADVLAVLDDLALPSGRIRIRAGGSSGGHNGLKDLQRVLGTDQYPRLRIGIDAPPPRVPGRDYVLGRFAPAQRPAVDKAVDRAASAVLKWIESGVEQAMNLFNADEQAEKREE
jgi:PTH1 family peptidyl-tRNA hydrolase